MTDSRPEAIASPKSRFSVVWIVPLLALTLGGWLTFKYLQEKGTTVQIEFVSADGLQAGKTKIKYKDVEIGIAQWSPTEDRVAVVTASSEVKLWDSTTSERVWAAEPFEAPDFAVARQPISLLFSSNGERFVVDSGIVNGQIRVFDSRDGSQPFAPTRVQRTGGNGSGDSMFWVDQDNLTVGVNGFATGMAIYDLTTGDAGPTLVDELLGTDTAFSTVLDQVISTGGPVGFHFWSLDGSGPLERVVPFTTAQREALAANGGNIYTALAPDGSRLLTSILALPDNKRHSIDRLVTTLVVIKIGFQITDTECSITLHGCLSLL